MAIFNSFLYVYQRVNSHQISKSHPGLTPKWAILRRNGGFSRRTSDTSYVITMGQPK